MRDDALRAAQVDVRLAVDKLECRLLDDLDVSLAERVAAAGIAGGRAANDTATRLHWARLSTCHAATVLERGGEATGLRELDEVLAASSDDAFVSALALALMERGTCRSRKGEMLAGQKDLLTACDLPKEPSLARELALCLGALADHHKRIDDLDGAMAL